MMPRSSAFTSSLQWGSQYSKFIQEGCNIHFIVTANICRNKDIVPYLYLMLLPQVAPGVTVTVNAEHGTLDYEVLFSCDLKETLVGIIYDPPVAKVKTPFKDGEFHPLGIEDFNAVANIPKNSILRPLFARLKHTAVYAKLGTEAAAKAEKAERDARAAKGYKFAEMVCEGAFKRFEPQISAFFKCP